MARFNKGRFERDNFSERNNFSEKIITYVIFLMFCASLISFIGSTQSTRGHAPVVKTVPEETKKKLVENDTLKKVVDRNQPEIGNLLSKATIVPKVEEPKVKIVYIKVHDTVTIEKAVVTKEMVPILIPALTVETVEIIDTPNKHETLLQKIFKRKRRTK